jgi:transcriptional regulator with XRE-family HTH domain
MPKPFLRIVSLLLVPGLAFGQFSTVCSDQKEVHVASFAPSKILAFSEQALSAPEELGTLHPDADSSKKSQLEKTLAGAAATPDGGVGEILRSHREAKRWTQKKLAEMTEISLRTIAQYEMGTTLPDLKRLHVLGEILDFNGDVLYRDHVAPALWARRQLKKGRVEPAGGGTAPTEFDTAGDDLWWRRTLKGLTMTELADRIPGLTHSRISEFENNKFPTSFNTGLNKAMALGKELDFDGVWFYKTYFIPKSFEDPSPTEEGPAVESRSLSTMENTRQGSVLFGSPYLGQVFRSPVAEFVSNLIFDEAWLKDHAGDVEAVRRVHRWTWSMGAIGGFATGLALCNWPTGSFPDFISLASFIAVALPTVVLTAALGTGISHAAYNAMRPGLNRLFRLSLPVLTQKKGNRTEVGSEKRLSAGTAFTRDTEVDAAQIKRIIFLSTYPVEEGEKPLGDKAIAKNLGLTLKIVREVLADYRNNLKKTGTSDPETAGSKPTLDKPLRHTAGVFPVRLLVNVFSTNLYKRRNIKSQGSTIREALLFTLKNDRASKLLLEPLVFIKGGKWNPDLIAYQGYKGSTLISLDAPLKGPTAARLSLKPIPAAPESAPRPFNTFVKDAQRKHRSRGSWLEVEEDELVFDWVKRDWGRVYSRKKIPHAAAPTAKSTGDKRLDSSS